MVPGLYTCGVSISFTTVAEIGGQRYELLIWTFHYGRLGGSFYLDVVGMIQVNETH